MIDVVSAVYDQQIPFCPGNCCVNYLRSDLLLNLMDNQHNGIYFPSLKGMNSADFNCARVHVKCTTLYMSDFV